MRYGFGYDIHRLVRGRKLVLGGVTIPFEKGLLGHSDADVLLHAVCDALLGAAAMGDIGRHFPETDPRLKDISSINLLEKTFQMIRSKGLFVNNLDATVLAEAPRLAPYSVAMKKNIARVLETGPEQINVKATTMEGLGAIGNGEAIAAMCVVALCQG
ncbi:MAG: 2-C-methyl-D-erythritol 2,4-cyclodiphosphate synthase [Deltaproteobacteria bacterium]|nr:2-C-methyl-D-erythritol 2,4-cyclodiphosphate synthase [Deltaproteobacteria bacterium]RLB90836.1 MAG: 2-C-methyl-D-erythritol 2,4-cyclodiphosphate synthase [Deltaproteobacteria bacterium]